MSRVPESNDILSTWEDQTEALERLFRARTTLIHEPVSRFFGLALEQIEERLRGSREELDRWAVLMLVSACEATLQTDARARIERRTKDALRKPLRALFETDDGQFVSLADILSIWESKTVMSSGVRKALHGLRKHRNWLAHGRHWTPKHGPMLLPRDAHAVIADYVECLRATSPDFPLV